MIGQNGAMIVMQGQPMAPLIGQQPMQQPQPQMMAPQPMQQHPMIMMAPQPLQQSSHQPTIVYQQHGNQLVPMQAVFVQPQQPQFQPMMVASQPQFGTPFVQQQQPSNRAFMTQQGVATMVPVAQNQSQQQNMMPVQGFQSMYQPPNTNLQSDQNQFQK